MRRPDHDPLTLDTRADQLDAVVDAFAALDVRSLDAFDDVVRGGALGVMRELRRTSSLLRRLADDLRLLDRFLLEAGLLAARANEGGDHDIPAAS